MVNSEAILTARGGMTSHAAVVARSMGKCCVAGATEIIVDEEAKIVKVGDRVFKEGDILSVNGSTGLVYEGEIKMVPANLGGDFGRLMARADKYRRLKVRANCNTPEDAHNARRFGAEGIGLFRIEHMFYGKNSETPLFILRKMILAGNEAERKAAEEAAKLAEEKPKKERKGLFGLFNRHS